MSRWIACPICHGQGTTGLITSSGAPQFCGICRGTGRLMIVPRRESWLAYVSSWPLWPMMLAWCGGSVCGLAMGRSVPWFVFGTLLTGVAAWWMAGYPNKPSNSPEGA